MAITFVQAAILTFASTATYVKAYTSNNTAGNTLIAISFNNEGNSNPTVTDSNLNTWVLVDALKSYNAVNTLACFMCLSCAAGANTVTYNTNTAANSGDLVILEYSGVGSLDKHGITNGSSSTPTSPSVTTTSTNEMLVGYFATGSLVTAGGYTSRANDGGNTLAEELAQPSIATVNATATAANGAWAAGILTLAPPGAGGGSVRWMNRERRFINKR